MQCNASVGRLDLRKFLSNNIGQMCPVRKGYQPPLWDCWSAAVANKTCLGPGTNGGFWYSTTSAG